MSKVFFAGVLFAASAACGGQGVRAAAVVPEEARAELRDMAGRAGVVFAGHVMLVSRVDGAGYVDVTFKVDEAVKGCSTHEGRLGTYVLREWAGLWRDDAARYVVGQRMLMMLAGRGPSGMSGPMDGGAGRMRILPVGAAVIADEAGAAPAEDGTDAAAMTAMMVDLRWVQAVAVRASDTGAAGVMAPDGNVPWTGPVAKLSQGAQPSVAAVLALLRGTGVVKEPGTVHVGR